MKEHDLGDPALVLQLRAIEASIANPKTLRRVFLCPDELFETLLGLDRIRDHSVVVRSQPEDFPRNDVQRDDPHLYVVNSRASENPEVLVPTAKTWYYYGDRHGTTARMAFLKSDFKLSHPNCVFREELKFSSVVADLENMYLTGLIAEGKD